MMDLYDVVSIGEALIDFTPFLEKLSDYPVFEQNPGGAPANMAAAAAAMGAKAAFIGKVGNDQFGRFLLDIFKKHNIATDGVVVSDDHHTSLAFVHLGENGMREFDFIRDADTMLREEEVNFGLLENTRLLHVSSLAFCSEETAKATKKAVDFAKRKGALISYDANWRPMLWRDQALGKQSLKIGVAFADIVKASEEELVYLTGEEGEKAGADFLLANGVQMVMVTKGPGGTAVYTKKAFASAPAFDEIKPVDTTGAGDACFGSFIWAFLSGGLAIDELNEANLADYQRTANAVASLSVAKRGGISSIPTRAEVEDFLAVR